MSKSTTRDNVKKLIDRLPEDSPWEEIIKAIKNTSKISKRGNENIKSESRIFVSNRKDHIKYNNKINRFFILSFIMFFVGILFSIIYIIYLEK